MKKPVVIVLIVVFILAALGGAGCGIKADRLHPSRCMEMSIFAPLI
jgi:hypothetical protein